MITTLLLTGLLQSGEIDLSIALRPLRSAGLKPRTLFAEEFCLAVSTEHPLHAQTSVPLAKLKQEKFILYEKPGHNTRELTMQYCRNAGFELEVAFESEQAKTAALAWRARCAASVMARPVDSPEVSVDLPTANFEVSKSHGSDADDANWVVCAR